MKRKIGFKNFRRFRSLDPVELSGVTFLVGKNNSGKSTIVKALLLIDNYFRSNEVEQFTFGRNVLEDANIVTYDRAKTVNSEEEPFISFRYEINDFEIDLKISAEFGMNQSEARVQNLRIHDTNENTTLEFEPQIEEVKLVKGRAKQPEKSTESKIDRLNERIKDLEKQLIESDLKKSSLPYLTMRDEAHRLSKRVEEISKISEDERLNPSLFHEAYRIHASDFPTASIFDPRSILNPLINLMDEISKARNLLAHSKDTSKKQMAVSESLRAFNNDRSEIANKFSTLLNELTSAQIYYLPAMSMKQSALLSIRDRNNPLAQAIHSYKQLQISADEKAKGGTTKIKDNSLISRFIKNWMNQFEVGDDFEITPHANEAYEVVVISDGKRIPLADKGMGSVQAMLLIFRLAEVVYKTFLKNEDQEKATLVIIEEPELNLHPALQSKLTDFFLAMHEGFGIDFIIETHSEYAVRKTQVLVKENEYEIEPNENPFSVIYFDRDTDTNWSMNYREDGKFKEDFGPGFFDVSGKLALDLI